MDGLLVPVSGIVFKYLILHNKHSVIFPIISQTFVSHPMYHIFDFLLLLLLFIYSFHTGQKTTTNIH